MFERMSEGKYNNTLIEKICCGRYTHLSENDVTFKQGM